MKFLKNKIVLITASALAIIAATIGIVYKLKYSSSSYEPKIELSENKKETTNKEHDLCNNELTSAQISSNSNDKSDDSNTGTIDGTNQTSEQCNQTSLNTNGTSASEFDDNTVMIHENSKNTEYIPGIVLTDKSGAPRLTNNIRLPIVNGTSPIVPSPHANKFDAFDLLSLTSNETTHIGEENKKTSLIPNHLEIPRLSDPNPNKQKATCTTSIVNAYDNLNISKNQKHHSIAIVPSTSETESDVPNNHKKNNDDAEITFPNNSIASNENN